MSKYGGMWHERNDPVTFERRREKGGRWPLQECDFGLTASMLKVQFGCLATVERQFGPKVIKRSLISIERFNGKRETGRRFRKEWTVEQHGPHSAIVLQSCDIRWPWLIHQIETDKGVTGWRWTTSGRWCNWGRLRRQSIGATANTYARDH